MPAPHVPHVFSHLVPFRLMNVLPYCVHASYLDLIVPGGGQVRYRYAGMSIILESSCNPLTEYFLAQFPVIERLCARLNPLDTSQINKP
jgi:hypothetical protein